MAFDALGNLYVANFTIGTIEKFAPNGVGTVFATGLNQPHGLAFDSAGNLSVANTGSGSILAFTPSGVESIFASNLTNPLSLAFAPSTVPEPSSLILGFLAVVSLGLFACVRH